MASGYNEFQRITDHLQDLEFGSSEDGIDYDEIADYVLKEWQRNAFDRARLNIITSSRVLVHKYHSDAVFKNAMDTVIYGVIAAVFARKDDEISERQVAIDLSKAVETIKEIKW